MERQKHELKCLKKILSPVYPGAGLYPVQRGFAKRTNFKLKEQLALKSNQTKLLKNRFFDEINIFMSWIMFYFYIIWTIPTMKQVHTKALTD